MKFPKTNTLLFFILSLVIVSCLDDDSSSIINNTPSTFEIIANSTDHTILEQVLIDTGLDEKLDLGVYTVFAPTDDAFNTIDLGNLSSDEVLNLINNHIINGNAESTDFSNGYITTNAVESVTGNNNLINMHINVDGGITLNGISTITEADQNASNGNVHIVDTVITLPNIATMIEADDNFSTLLQVLTRDDQPDFISTLQSTDTSSPLTLFAPRNAAFDDLLEELNLPDLDSIGTNTLTSALNTHIIENNNLRVSDFVTGSIQTTGDAININAETLSITDLNDRQSNIIGTNIQVSNGILHVLDTVLLAL